MLKRTKQISLRLTEKELEYINKNAKRCGLAREKYIRTVALGVVPKEQPNKDFYDIIYQLKMIGLNIRQIAIKAQTLNFIDSLEYCRNYEKLQEIVGVIIKALY